MASLNSLPNRSLGRHAWPFRSLQQERHPPSVEMDKMIAGNALWDDEKHE